MSFDIQIRDFQSLRKVDLSLDRGLTVIIGDTNGGKSAIIRAIDKSLFNTGADSDVRSGNRYAGTQLSNGRHKMIWRRDNHGKNEKTVYQWDGKDPVTKVGKTQLEEVAQMFNITEVRMANGQKEKINFWFQGDHPFLTDRTPGQLFEFLSLSSCDEYIAVLKDMKVDKTSLNNDIIAKTASIDTLRMVNEEKRVFIESNEGFDDVYAEVVTMDSEIQGFNLIEGEVNQIKGLMVKGKIKGQEHQGIVDKLGAIDFDAVLEEYKAFEDLGNLFNSIGSALSNIQKKGDNLKILEKQLGVIRDQGAYLGDKLIDLGKEYQGLLDLSGQVQDLGPRINNIYARQDLLSTQERELGRIQGTLSGIDINGIKAEMDALVNTSLHLAELSSKLGVIKDKKDNYTSKNKSLGAAISEREQADQLFESYKVEIGACPYCGSTL